MAATLIQHVMSTPILTIAPAMLASEALELAFQHAVHHLPVVRSGVALGMVCTCDLEDAQPNASVSVKMRTPPIAAGPNTPNTEALELMNSHRVGSLLVIDGTSLLGIVTRRDLEASGLPMRDDPRGHCSCCGSISHLREHATGCLCAECWGRSRSCADIEHGGGD